MIRKIHQIWLQGEDNLPNKYKKYVSKYKELNSPHGWEYKLWDEGEIRDLIKSKYHFLLSVFDDYEFWVMKVDLGKYCILDSEGGLVIDMDTKPMRSFEGILDQESNKPIVIFYPHRNDGKSNFHFLEKAVHRITNNNFIYSPQPHHPFMKFLLKRAMCTFERMPWDFKLYYVVGSIGPLFLIDSIEEYGSNKIRWIPETEIKNYFLDERANSWNKKHYDDHDVYWGSFFIILLLFAIYCGYKAI